MIRELAQLLEAMERIADSLDSLASTMLANRHDQIRKAAAVDETADRVVDLLAEIKSNLERKVSDAT